MFDDLPPDLRVAIRARAHPIRQLDHALRSAVLKVHGSWVVVAQGHRACGLFRSHRSHWCCVHGVRQCATAQALFRMLHHLAESVLGAWYGTRPPRAKQYPSQEWVLKEFVGGSLRGTRCVRLLEYINFDLFDYDCLHVMDDGDAMPDSRCAAEFLLRWERSYDVLPDLQYGCMNELTEKDVSKSWF